MTETQERFLRTVLTRVAIDSVVELHLFPPIRRGTMETGVAVIATVLPPAPLTVVEAGPDVAPEAVTDMVPDAVIDVEREAVTDVAAEASDGDEASPYAADTVESVSVTDTDPSQPSDAADVAVAGALDGEFLAAPDDDAEPIEPAVARPPVAAPRLRILTAAYRHTIKGVERGKWVVDVQEEADAPLEAVEAVLRGVRHRSSEPADPELVTQDTLAALVAPARVAPAA